MNKKKNIEIVNWDLQVKFLAGEADSTEKQELNNWLNSSGENLDEFSKNRELFETVNDYYKIKHFNSVKAWKNIQAQTNLQKPGIAIHKNSRKEVMVQFYKIAAVLIIAIVLSSIGYYIGFKNHEPVIFQEIISAQNQVLNHYLLPDGTVVALNSNSQLRFPKKFKKNKREVFLTGEAFFDVTPNPEKPFLIHAGNAHVKVLGTSFNVRAYPENKTVEVIVESGKVEVSKLISESLPERKGIFLEPGEKGTLYSEDNLLEKSVNLDPNFMAWKTHDLIFNEVPLKNVIECLENVYHVQIELAENRLKNELYTAHFDKKPVEFVLDVVSLSFNLELSIDENEKYTLYAPEIINK